MRRAVPVAPVYGRKGPEGPEGPQGPPGRDALGAEATAQVLAGHISTPGEVQSAVDARVPEAGAGIFAAVDDPRFGSRVVQENLWLNPSVEGVGGLSAMGWISGVNASLHKETGEYVRSGSVALKVVQIGSGGMGPSPRMDFTDLAPATEHTFSAWVYNPAANLRGVYLRADGAGVAGTPVDGTDNNVRDTWVQVTLTFTTAAVVDASNPVRLFIITPHGSGDTAYVDDLGLAAGAEPVTGSGDDDGWEWAGTPYQSTSRRSSVTYIVREQLIGPNGLILDTFLPPTLSPPPDENLFLDPSFERNGSGSLNGGIGGLNSTISPDTTLKRSGAQSCKITAAASPGSGGVTPHWDFTDLLPNRQYTFSTHFYNPVGNTSGVSVRASGAVVGSPQTGLTVNIRNAWVQASVTFTTGPVVDASNPVQLFVVSSSGGGEVVNVDDFGLCFGTTPVTGDGDMSGWEWTGTPYLSTSLRSGAVIEDAAIAPLVTNLATATGKAMASTFAGKESILPAESSLVSVSAACQHVRNATEQEIPTGASGDPIPIGAWGGVLYGFRVFKLYSSADNGRTWTLIQDIAGMSSPSGIVDLRLLGDGEVLLIRGAAGAWKSSGWNADPTTATWVQVIATTSVADDGTHGAVQGDINSWGVSVWSNYVFITEYQGDGDYRPASRYAWLSTDNGSTFSVVYDLNINPDGVNGLTSHLHATEIDRHQLNGSSQPRLWLSHHDYDNGSGIGGQRIRYSDNLGATWVTWLADVPDAQPTTIVAMPQAILFGSDGIPDGVLRTRRTKDGLSPPERPWTWRTTAPGLSFICRRVVRVSDSLALFSFRSRRDGVPGVVVATDGLQAEEVYRTAAVSDNQPFITWASVVDGEFVARSLVTGSGAWDRIVRGTAPTFAPVDTSAAPQTVWWQERATDGTRTNTTTATDSGELTITGLLPGTYLLSAWVKYDSADTSADMKLGFAFTGTATLDWQVAGAGTAPTSELTTIQHNTVTTGLAGTANYGAPAGTVTNVARPNGVLKVTAAGSLKVQWAQSVASATPTTMRAGSWIRLEKVA